MIIIYLSFQLPDDSNLKSYKPDVMTRVYDSNGQLVREFSKEYRIFVPIENIPDRLKNAFISAEDKNFYNHIGIDPSGIIRALIRNTYYIFSDKRPEGASTITQQVAKNFLLNDELSLSRKAKEALLAIKIDATLSKSRILELYLNQIYLGYGTYGVAAASNRYFNKSLEELDLSEVSFLAALPKAPSKYNPKKNYNKSLIRRNWVLKRMYINKYITEEEYKTTIKTTIQLADREKKPFFSSDYYLEEIRKQIIKTHGEDVLYTGGLSVRSSLDTSTQRIADLALKSGLLEYDKRNGYRGVIDNKSSKSWFSNYLGKDQPHNFLLAKVTKLDEMTGRVDIEVLKGKNVVQGHLLNFNWARKSLGKGYLGPKINQADDVFNINDIIHVSLNSDDLYNLEQIPKINGAIIVMDPHTGRVFALSGGFDFNESNFNRVYQAKRQPGSSFKPFVYIAALENGLQPNSLILDAPFVLDQGKGRAKWKPENYGKKFYGPSTLRTGLEKSRNLMTVRIAQNLGIDKVAKFSKSLGIYDDPEELLSISLGSAETTLLKLASAYSAFINGGKLVEPVLIDRVQDSEGNTIVNNKQRSCINCDEISFMSNQYPEIKDNYTQVFSPQTAYQMTSLLEGVIQRGTGKKLKKLELNIAGKTGTTNENTDAWFIGFTSNLIIGVYVGMDDPKSLGRYETGSKTALPIFKDFVEKAVKKSNARPFKVAEDIIMMVVDPNSGKKAKFSSKNTIVEAFKKKNVVDGKVLYTNNNRLDTANILEFY